VLLVGGASERFGSPKALARLDGETLAERAFSTLSQACDEVLVVGKQADGLSLPFPLLDDGGGAGRAPVLGVAAGLSAAAHDVCVVLPVDCPLVTPQLVRALGEAVAVPQTGPLPGAYSRGESLAALRERIARGELSLRGINRRVLEVDPLLVADVDTPAELARLAVDRLSHFRH
jgi:molybdopterin-guanine dinucleotide biosynthesis protein A